MHYHALIEQLRGLFLKVAFSDFALSFSGAWKIAISTCHTSCCGVKTSSSRMDGRSTTFAWSVFWSGDSSISDRSCRRCVTASSTRGTKFHVAWSFYLFVVEMLLRMQLWTSICRQNITYWWFHFSTYRAHHQLNGIPLKALCPSSVIVFLCIHCLNTIFRRRIMCLMRFSPVGLNFAAPRWVRCFTQWTLRFALIIWRQDTKHWN